MEETCGRGRRGDQEDRAGYGEDPRGIHDQQRDRRSEAGYQPHDDRVIQGHAQSIHPQAEQDGPHSHGPPNAARAIRSLEGADRSTSGRFGMTWPAISQLKTSIPSSENKSQLCSHFHSRVSGLPIGNPDRRPLAVDFGGAPGRDGPVRTIARAV